MGVTLKVDGIYIDEDKFEHTKTKYTITNDESFETIIGTHESSNSSELYEYEFDVILSRKDTLYYLIEITVEDDDDNEYIVSSGIRTTNVYGQLSGKRSLLKTPDVSVRNSRIGNYKQLEINVKDVVSYSDDETINSLNIEAVSFTGEKLWSNKNTKHSIKDGIIPINILNNTNYLVEVSSNSDTTKSFKGRKLIINDEETNFSELISEPILVKSEYNIINIKTSLLISGSIIIELYNALNELIPTVMSGHVEYTYDSLLFKLKSDFIERGEKYKLIVRASGINDRTLTDEYIFTGMSTDMYLNRRNINFDPFVVREVALNLNHLSYTKGYSNMHSNGLIPMPSINLLAFYDLDDRVVNYGYTYRFEERDYILTSTEALEKNFLILGIKTNDDDETALQFTRFSFDNMNIHELEEDNVIIDFKDNYLDVTDYYNDRYECIYDDGSGFTIVYLDKDTGELTKQSDVIDDLSVYRDAISNTDSILITSIRVGAYLYSFAKSMLSKVDVTDTSSVEINTLDIPDDTTNNRFLRVSEATAILSTTNSDNIVVLYLIDLINCSVIKSTNTKLAFNQMSIAVDNNNHLNFITKTNYGHSVLELK
jgi:hypothetical protein